jgi:3-oxoacyl-[acyl-carrier-protein] synthase II
MFKRVVVTGLGALTPIGNDIPAYWEGLSNGVSGAARITRFDPEKFKTKFACEVKDFDVKNYIDFREAKRMDWFTQYAMVVADEAMKDCGLDLTTENRNRIGVIWASGIGGLKTFEEEVLAFGKGDGTPRFNPFFIPKMIANMASGTISIKYGLRGMSYTTVSACTSSNNALMDALTYIRLGKADVIVTGGSEAAVTQSGMGGFSVMKALSERNDSLKTF